MHNNFYFLRQLTKSLDATLRHSVVSECFSQNKDELVIRFEVAAASFFIRASLSPSFSCLSFPSDFHRARKNSVDLFNDIIGQRVTNLHQFENERSFAMHLSNGFVLLFKMHGNRSNIVLFENNEVTGIFKNNLVEDQALDLSRLDRSIDWTYENFVQHHAHPEQVYFTFGKLVWKFLNAHNYGQLPVEQQFQMIQDVRRQLEAPRFLIQDIDGKSFFSLLEIGQRIKEFSDPIRAIHEFFLLLTYQETFSREKSSTISRLKSELEAADNYIDKTNAKLLELQADNHYKTWADVLMANLHIVKSGMEKVTLADFYHDDRPLDIKLKRDLSPQDNAAIFYRKAKNQQIEIDHIQQLLLKKQQEKDKLIQQLKEAEDAQDVKGLRKLVDSLRTPQEKEKQAAPLPYKEIEYKGFKIWIGKNAASNDTLTLKYGYKEDLWLHAKDVAGSHVLLKHQAGKNFPKDVIERAAQLAAYYSKRKHESLCPVSFTARKFVRKRKGDPPGAVVVEREEVVMVVPAGT